LHLFTHKVFEGDHTDLLITVSHETNCAPSGVKDTIMSSINNTIESVKSSYAASVFGRYNEMRRSATSEAAWAGGSLGRELAGGGATPIRIFAEGVACGLEVAERHLSDFVAGEGRIVTVVMIPTRVRIRGTRAVLRKVLDVTGE